MNKIKEIQKVKRFAESEIIQWLSILSQLESIEKIAKADAEIGKAFKAKK